jgi:methyl-accepting chemotaxis protein
MAGAVRAMTQNSAGVKSLVDDVNSGSQEQSAGIERISRAVLQMQTVTRQTAADAKGSASAGTELMDDAEKLQGLVKEMREMVGAE